MTNPLPATPLWTRLCGYSLDAIDTELSFSRRLARDNGWTRTKALRAIEEYKRFVYLALTAGHPVTPSDEVDQVWHLHLLYTDSYWNEFCAVILQSPLHHTPTKGGKREGEKFYDWYERTKNSYAKVFGTLPPAELWPETRVRFSTASHFKRVNTKTSWVIAKPAMLSVPAPEKLRQRNFVSALPVLVLLSAVSCAAASQHQQAAVNIFLILALVLTPIVIAVLWTVNASRRKGRGRRRQRGDIGGVYVGDVGGSSFGAGGSGSNSSNDGFGGEGGTFGGGGASSSWDSGDSGGDSSGGDSGGDGGGGCGGGCGGGGD